MMGAERRSMVMSEDEKKLTAYHEGGHAIVALNEKVMIQFIKQQLFQEEEL
jgi:cell division protease FtsH